MLPIRKLQKRLATFSGHERGFTLIEMLVVIAIISILIGIGINTFTIAQQKARDVRRKADIHALQTAFEARNLDTGFYTPGGAANWGSTVADGSWGADGTNPNSLKNIFTPNYISEIPRDPIYNTGTDDYYINFTDSPNGYKISVKLENLNDPDMARQTCSPAAGRNYCVTNQ